MPFLNWPQWSVVSAITTVLDIAIVAYVIYRILLLIKGTRAVQLIKGIVVLLIALNFSDYLDLHTIKWILDQIWTVIFVALAVIFQPELRRALEQIGRGRFFLPSSMQGLVTGDAIQLIDELTKAIVSCAKTKTGALVILERETGLSDYIETGVYLDALVSEAFLTNIFVKNTPLHDGAAIIRGNRVLAAACFLPLSDNPYISTSLGTRHRAAIGITEVSDALALVVSEETGIISVAKDGKLVRYLEEKHLRQTLSEALLTKAESLTPFWKKGGSKHEKI